MRRPFLKYPALPVRVQAELATLDSHAAPQLALLYLSLNPMDLMRVPTCKDFAQKRLIV